MKALALLLLAACALPAHAQSLARDVASGPEISRAQDLRRGDPEALPRRSQPAPRPDARAEAPARPTPPADEAEGRKRILDELYERLAKARDEEEAKGVAGAIERVLLRSGSDTADLLMSRARQAIGTKDHKVAIDILDKVVALEPTWAEAWRHRATARFLAGDRGGAVSDLGETLALEPRHFEALTGLGSILHANGFDKRALDVLRRALAVHPQQPEVRSLVEQLQPDVEGRDI